MAETKTMITSLSVYSDGQHPIFGEGAITIRVDDEGGGMFLVLEQEGKEIKVDPEEWQHIHAAVWRLMDEIKANEVSND